MHPIDIVRRWLERDGVSLVGRPLEVTEIVVDPEHLDHSGRLEESVELTHACLFEFGA
jgi:hypothetical protein